MRVLVETLSGGTNVLSLLSATILNMKHKYPTVHSSRPSILYYALQLFFISSGCDHIAFDFLHRNVECLNLLLSSGADLRRRDKFGR